MPSAGRPRKSIAELERSGTYRKDRHGERKKEEKLLQTVLPKESAIFIPATLTDQYVIDCFTQHTNFLSQLHLYNESDSSEIEEMFRTLQLVRELWNELNKIDRFVDLDRFERIEKMRLKESLRFSTLASKYFISPLARNKIALDALHVEKAKQDIAVSAIDKLIANKKS